MEWYLDISLGPVENPHKGATKDSSVEPLVIDSDHLHSLGALLVHGPSVGRNNLYPRLIPVQNQFWWDFLHFNRCHNISQKRLFQLFKVFNRVFALGCGDFPLYKFHAMQERIQYAQCRFTSIRPPNSTSFDRPSNSWWYLQLSALFLLPVRPLDL